MSCSLASKLTSAVSTTLAWRPGRLPLGTEPVADSKARPEALRAHLKSEIDRWGPIIKKAGVYAD